MSSTVWKFPLPFPGPDVFEIAMPAGADILTVQVQHGEPRVWALVQDDVPMLPRRLRIAGTGHPIDETILRYVGTFQVAGGSLIFHLFEVRP